MREKTKQNKNPEPEQTVAGIEVEKKKRPYLGQAQAVGFHQSNNGDVTQGIQSRCPSTSHSQMKTSTCSCVKKYSQ